MPAINIMDSHIKSVLTFETKDGKAEPISSPRSLEACLRLGYDPQELMPRGAKTFLVKGEPPELTKIRHNFFERRRREKIETVKNERHTIISFHESPYMESDSLPSLSKADRGGFGDLRRDQQTIGGDAEAEARRVKAGFLEMGRRQGAAIAEKQARELERVVVKEQELADVYIKILRAEEVDAKRQAEHEKKTAEVRAAMAERRHLKEMEKYELEKKDDELRKELTKQAAAAEERLKEAERVAEARRLAEIAEREGQRRASKEKRLQAALALIRKREEEEEQRKTYMALREERVQAQLDEKKAAKAAEVAAERAFAEKRIQEVLETKKKIQQEKKNAYERKVAEVEKRKKEKAEQEQILANKRAEEQQKLDDDRAKRLEASYQERADRRKGIISRRQEREKFYGQIRSEKEKEWARRKLYHDLVMEDRRQNIERLRRVDEFVRLQMEVKIEEEMERTERAKAQREYLIEQRIVAANQVMKEKLRVKEAIDKMKATNNFENLGALLEGLVKSRHEDNEDEEMEPDLGLTPPSA